MDQKGVSARADAEAWMPVDMDMPKTMRDKVFAKAGTRSLPLLFVDDEFVGDYPTIAALEVDKKLDAIFDY